MEWYRMVLQKYAQFDGRSRRMEYWMYNLVNLLIICGIYALAFVTVLMDQKGLAVLFFVASGAYALATLIPSLAVSVRRLHDTNKSGWLILICFVPLVGGIVLLVLMAIEGDAGPNQYGPNPKELAYPAAIR